MDMFKSLALLVRHAGQPPPGEFGPMLDHWIREALVEEALAQPPCGAWERLRKALDRRRGPRHGMWVLDEPLRDPPDSLPTMLSQDEYRRAYRLYRDSRPDPMWHIRDNMFNHLSPTLVALLSL